MRILIPFLIALAFAPLAAHASVGDCLPEHIVEATGGSGGTTFYVRWSGDAPTAPVANGAWLYAESNGAWNEKPAGVYVDPQGDLQAGGSSQIMPDDNEICVDDSDIGPDMLIF